jgi:acyl-[acyl carrier protein]--UDP-N-acetylglucosamine O-acyltransferase
VSSAKGFFCSMPDGSLAPCGNDTLPSTIYIGKTKVVMTYAEDVNGTLLQPKQLVKMEFPGSVTFGKNDLISTTAKIGENVSFGDNCFVGGGVVIRHDNHFGSNVIIDRDAKILPSNDIEDNVTIGRETKIGPHNLIEHNAVLGPRDKFGTYNVIGRYVILDADVQLGSHNTVPWMQPVDGISKISIDNNVTFRDFNAVGPEVHIGSHNHFGSCNRILEKATFDPLTINDAKNTIFGSHHYGAADRISSVLARTPKILAQHEVLGPIRNYSGKILAALHLKR